MASSRVKQLEMTLSILGYKESLHAFDLMIKEMCAEKGYKRHNGTHYYYHLVDVTQKLINFGIRDEVTITATLLHDYAEDVPGVTIELIEQDFGKEVAHVVDLLTKKPNVDYKKAANITAYLEAIAQNVKASLIKTADRMHNFGSLKDASPEKKMRQAKETEKYFIPFFKTCRNLYPRYANFFFEAKTQIEPHLWEIKEHYEEVNRLNAYIKELEEKIKIVSK